MLSRAKKNVSLKIHKGASIPDPFGLLEGEGETSRVARYVDDANLDARQAALIAVIQGWTPLQDQV